MKRNLFLASAIVLAALASCTKESTLDPSIASATSSQTPIEFSTYAASSSSTKGAAVNSNSDFQGGVETHGSFDVVALISDMDEETLVCEYDSEGFIESFKVDPKDGTGVFYFGFGSVDYTDGIWTNASKMYWPNYSKVIHFAAYSPSNDTMQKNYAFSQSTTSGVHSYNYAFDFVVDSIPSEQIDLMYALTSVNYLAPSDKYKKDAVNSYITSGVTSTNDEEPVNLHFKHALTQVAFTATKDSDIQVFVKSITICNVYNSGRFTATVVTDDVDTSEDDEEVVNDSDTVGDSGVDGDKVNASNFGTWETSFTGVWNNLKQVENGSYYAVEGSGGLASMSNYTVPFATFTSQSYGIETDDDADETGNNSIEITSSTEAVNLTSDDDVLMLIPQKLTAWTPNTSNVLNYAGVGSDINNLDGTVGADTEAGFAGYPGTSTATESQSYLAIDCEIYHTGATDYGAKIHDGYIFVPFETTEILYNEADVDNAVKNADEWLAGYKITYCLNFGGGYVVEEGHTTTIPEPGTTPDTNTYTLRTITYTTTVDTWVDVNSDGTIELLDHDTSGSNSDTTESSGEE